MVTLESSVSIDSSYGRTPEKAILNVLQKQPAFDAHDVDYVGERPGFWNVEPHDFHSHDWEQYEWRDSVESNVKGYPLTISVRDQLDPIPEGKEGRKHLRINNVLLNVGRTEPESGEEERASARFQLTLQMRESAWDATDEPSPGDLQWRAELISTQLIDRSLEYGAGVSFGQSARQE